MAEINPTSVTQEKTYGNEEAFAAAYAVDKDFLTQAATHTDNGVALIKLKFDKTYFIHKVVIYYRFFTHRYRPADYCVESEATFRLCVDDANNVDVSVYQGEVLQKSCGTLQLTYGLEQSDQIYTLLCNTEGDSVKLIKTSGNIVVAEVFVTSSGIHTPFLKIYDNTLHAIITLANRRVDNNYNVIFLQ